MAKSFLLASAISGFLSVALGAFGAHGLKERLDAYHLGVYQTGVQYQFYHCFALGIVGLLLLRGDNDLLRGAGWAFVTGTVVFSGSLYILALSGVKTWGAITPLGGAAFLLGWVLLTVSVARMPLP